MGRFLTPSVIIHIILTVILAAIFASSGGSVSWSSLGSTALTTSPMLDTLVMPGDLGYFYFESWTYEVVSALDATQGLTTSCTESYVIFNPSADVDLSTSTDFEDLAGPAADVLEFGDQDRALLTDSSSSVIFWNGVMGGLIGISIHVILSSDLWRFIS